MDASNLNCDRGPVFSAEHRSQVSNIKFPISLNECHKTQYSINFMVVMQITSFVANSHTRKDHNDPFPFIIKPILHPVIYPFTWYYVKNIKTIMIFWFYVVSLPDFSWYGLFAARTYWCHDISPTQRLAARPKNRLSSRPGVGNAR